MPGSFAHGYALLIGVGASAHPAWSLPVTVRDTLALAEVLADPALCGYPNDDEHLRILVDAKATGPGILDGLKWLAAQVAADADATAVVFFSGHGWLEEASGQYFLVPHDAEPPTFAERALPAETFTEALREVRPERLLVFLDCCHAGGMASAKGAGSAPMPPGFEQSAVPKDLARELRQGAGRVVFSSSTGAQRSWTRPDNTMSIYTHHLIEALKGAGNRPGDTDVRVSNLMNYLARAVPESARVLCRQEQTPFFEMAAEDFPVALLRGRQPLAAAPASMDRNVNQQGKYSIYIENAYAPIVGDGQQVTQTFYGSPEPGPARPDAVSDIARRHLKQQWTELERRHEALSERIRALDTGINRELDPERLWSLRERRRELEEEREQVVAEMTRIEEELARRGE